MGITELDKYNAISNININHTLFLCFITSDMEKPNSFSLRSVLSDRDVVPEPNRPLEHILIVILYTCQVGVGDWGGCFGSRCLRQ